MTSYQVIGECAHVEVRELGGTRSIQMLYKGAPVPDGVSTERLEHLLRSGLIADTADQPIAPNAAAEQDPARGLASVTTEVLQGEKPAEPRQDPALAAGERVAETVTAEGGIDKAAQPSREDAEFAEKRAAAQAKLAEIGEPDGRSSQAVWVEHLVATGSRYEDVASETKADLVKLAESRKS